MGVRWRPVRDLFYPHGDKVELGASRVWHQSSPGKSESWNEAIRARRWKSSVEFDDIEYQPRIGALPKRPDRGLPPAKVHL